jgi:hypothetical protein
VRPAWGRARRARVPRPPAGAFTDFGEFGSDDLDSGIDSQPLLGDGPGEPGPSLGGGAGAAAPRPVAFGRGGYGGALNGGGGGGGGGDGNGGGVWNLVAGLWGVSTTGPLPRRNAHPLGRTGSLRLATRRRGGAQHAGQPRPQPRRGAAGGALAPERWPLTTTTTPPPRPQGGHESARVNHQFTHEGGRAGGAAWGRARGGACARPPPGARRSGPGPGPRARLGAGTAGAPAARRSPLHPPSLAANREAQAQPL